MIIEFIFQLIFIILSYMCFKSDDILNFDITFKELSKAINMYRSLFFITTNYMLLNNGFIYMYESLCDYMKILAGYLTSSTTISSEDSTVYYIL